MNFENLIQNGVQSVYNFYKFDIEHPTLREITTIRTSLTLVSPIFFGCVSILTNNPNAVISGCKFTTYMVVENLFEKHLFAPTYWKIRNLGTCLDTLNLSHPILSRILKVTGFIGGTFLMGRLFQTSLHTVDMLWDQTSSFLRV